MNRRNLVLIICAVAVLLIIIWLIAVKMRDNSTDNITISTETTTENSSSITSNSSDTENIADYVAEEDIIMHQMMENMMNVEKSGSADIDFLAGMIPHHRSAIEMSESYLSHNPQNADIKTLAENIISVQQEEIDTMNSLINSIKESGVADTEKAEAYQDEYTHIMHTSHSHSVNEYNTIDQAFADGMIEHHQMAVDMSNLILKYSDNEEVRKLAENIINAQEKEIEQMNTYLTGM